AIMHGIVTDEILAREAHTARRLAVLMRQYERVLWVGGMGHWPRIRERLAARDFNAPRVTVRRPRRFERMLLAPSALWHTTARMPYLVAHYGAFPETYDEDAALRSLAVEALDLPEGEDVRI